MYSCLFTKEPEERMMLYLSNVFHFFADSIKRFWILTLNGIVFTDKKMAF